MVRAKVLGTVAALALLAVPGCQLTEQSPPSTPTPVSLVPLVIPVIGAPTPAPKPSPAPSSTPTPTPGTAPTPAPSPTPTPPPSGSACSLPPSNPPSENCRAETQSFLANVDQAINRVTQLYPQLFDFKDTKCENCYFVKDASRFTTEVMKELGRQGLCAGGNTEEIGVKSSNTFNDQYDILLSSGHIRRGPHSYQVTCRPAVF